MADAATPTSSSHTPNKLSAPKDRKCPYCKISFTSSSLGRHLDLYIKEKNPKPADGVHNVDEIRQSRGGITRRQARSSTGRRDGISPTNPSHMRGSDMLPPATDTSDVNGTIFTSLPAIFPQPHWTTTGVINDLAVPTTSARVLQQRGNIPRHSNRVEIAARKQNAEERERGRAAELALIELVDTIKAAE